MRKMIRWICLFFLPFSFYAYSQVPEIPDTSIQDIAITTVRGGQVVILWNPLICNQVGVLVCRFMRAHEYGHVSLGHLLKPGDPRGAEFEADCYAAKNAPLIEVQAAYLHFYNSGFMGTWSHGTGMQRAQRIAECSAGRLQ